MSLSRWNLAAAAAAIALAAAPARAFPQSAKASPEAQRADSLYRAQDFRGALTAYRALTGQAPGNGLYWYRLGVAAYQLDSMPAAAAAFERAAARPGNPFAPYNAAATEARLGHTDEAFKWLAQTAKTGAFGPGQIDADSDFASLRNDPRYATIKASMVAPTPCLTDSNARKFDFWVGEWNVTTAGGAPVGQSSITLVPGHCALLEKWSANNGSTGQSLSAYNPVLQHWQQFYVAQIGRVTEYREGRWQDSSLVLVAPAPADRADIAWQRMTYTPMGPNLVRQLGEISTDGGKTWQPGYDFYYHRK